MERTVDFTNPEWLTEALQHVQDLWEGTPNCFADLDRFNQVMETFFLHHQLALLQQNPEAALFYLQFVYELYQLHAKQTSELLLPNYELFVPHLRQGGAPYFFEREHQFILKQLSTFMKTVSDYALAENIPSTGLVSLFDNHYQLKEMFDHHHARDRYFLFPDMDAHMPESDRDILLNRVWQELDDRFRRVMQL